MADDSEIIVKLTAQTAQLKAGMAEGAAVVKTTQDEMAASMATSMNAFRNFDSITKESVKSTEGLAEAQAALTAVQSTGAFTAEEIAAKQALVSEAMAKVARDTKASSGAMGALTSNSRTMYSASALATDLMTGQFSRSRREVAALSNETGLMARAFRFAVSPLGILTMGVGVLGAAAIEAGRDFNSFEEAVQASNGYMGITAGELQAMAQKIGDLTNSYDNAKEAVIGLATSGRFTGEQLTEAATAAVQFADITGEKVSQVDRFMVEMATHPQKALEELVDKYHRVTPAQAQVIEALIKEGNAGAATAAMIKAMGTSVSQSFDKQAQHAGALSRVLQTLGYDFGEVWRGIGNSLQLATGGGDAAEKLNALQHQMADMRASHETTGGYKVAYEHIQQEAEALQKVIDKEHEAAAAGRKAAAAWSDAHPTQGSFAALQKEGLGGVDLTGNLTKQLSMLEAAQHTAYNKMADTAANYWQYVLEHTKAGTAQNIEAYHQVEENNKRVDDEQLASSERTERKREELARKSAEVAKREAAGVARAQEEASREWQAEIKQESEARKQAALTDAETARQVGDARIADERQHAQTEYTQGKITTGQLLQIQNDLVQQKLALEVAYLKAKQALDAGDVDAAKRDAAQIKVATYQADQERSANLAKSVSKNENTWKEYTQRVQGMVTSQINAMLFQHQTLRNAVANIAESMAETWISNDVKALFNHQEVEAAKTAATFAGNAARVGADTTGQAESLAVQGESAVKWIMTEAAKAAAGAFNAMAAIPVVGPFLAAGASIAAFATVAALVGKVASAEGGWERVPADGMMTQLHRDEMVLPAHIANPMRDMVRKGGAGGGVHHHHYTIKAYDRRGLSDFVARNGIELGKGLQHLARNGHVL